ncbi:DUF342 domain-containing protein [bacterium 3DAC]|nr:DUF342 domain-containing protein [bacterium 3DAC]
MKRIHLENFEIFETEDGIYAVSYKSVPRIVVSGILSRIGFYPPKEVLQAIALGNGKPVKISDPVDRDADIEVSITEDNLRAYIQYIPAFGKGKDLEVTDILQKLVEEYKIDPQFIRVDAVKEAIENPLDIIIVAEGVPPEEGKNASIVILPLDEVEIDPYEEIDWHAYKKHFITVREGEIIGRKNPPSLGRDGVDIFGRIIPAKPGRDIDLKTFAGDGTEASGDVIISKTTGILVLGGVLSVEEILIIDGDVDFSVGNITGVKHLWIKGDVKPGFVIKVKGKVLVEGSVENASVHAGEGVFIRGIVTGDKAGVIRSGGFVYIKEGHIARIEAEDNVYIETGLYGSKVEALGDVVFVHPRARLRGGEIKASGSIYVPIVVSARKLSTKLYAGYTDTIRKRILDVQKELTELISKKEHLEKLMMRVKNATVREKIRTELSQIHAAIPLVEKDIAELSTFLRKTTDQHIYIAVSASEGAYFRVADSEPYVVRGTPLGRCRLGYKDGETVLLPWNDPAIDINPPVIKSIKQ